MDIDASDTAPDVQRAVRGAWSGRPRILIIEDDHDVAAGLQWTLSQSYDVAAEFSALKALGWCSVHWPDLLIVDFQLPDLDGIELLRVLRESSRVRAPALMISAFEDRASRAIRNGFEDFIAKPICEWELAMAVERTLGF
jgi:DNA-binding response OmpR family regulator